jgi:hypothetical protein
MPQLYPYRIFISHAWDYNDEYYRLEKMLTDFPNFEFRNYSVPKHDALDSSESLTSKLRDQMNPVQVVLVLAGMYATHSDWIQFEINEAKRLGKPIVGVKPWGQERVPENVEKSASLMVGWNAAPIVDSIRQLA